MGLYDLFLALMNEKASKNLLACRDFASFKALAHNMEREVITPR